MSDPAPSLEEQLADCQHRLKNLEDKFQAFEQPVTESNTTKPLIVCLIDGDGCIFTKEAIEDGHEGGRIAARRIKESIVDDCKELIQGDFKDNCILLVDIFMHGVGMKKTLWDHFRIDREVFHHFVAGFNASSSMTIMDVGEGTEAADNKIRDLMNIFVNEPRVRRLYFGGGHDGGYAPILTKFEEKGYIHKIVLFKGYDEPTHRIGAYNLRHLQVPGLFLPKKLLDRNKISGPDSRPGSRLEQYPGVD